MSSVAFRFGIRVYISDVGFQISEFIFHVSRSVYISNCRFQSVGFGFHISGVIVQAC